MQDEDHALLEQEAGKWLSENNFLIAKQPYHEYLEDSTINHLQNRFTLTALGIRGRADRFASHQEYPLDFEWEVKTTPANSQWPNFSIEIWPLIRHRILAQLMGIQCLYVCRHCVENYEFGFWVDNIPKIWRIRFPERQEYGSIREKMKETIGVFFPGIEIENCPPNYHRGVSNDPYFLIRKEIGETLPHWKNLILDEVQAISHN